MRILVDGRVLTHKLITGVERYTRDILSAFNKIGIQYDIVYPKTKNRYLQHVWEHTTLPLKARKYDILFCPGNIAPLWKFSKVKQVVVIYDLSFLYFPDAYTKSFVYYYKVTIPQIMKVSDKIITISEGEKEKILQKYPYLKQKIVAIQPGLSENFLNVESYHQDKKNFILYVGSLNPRKNIIGVIKAFVKLLDKIPHQLYIVGTTSNIFTHKKEMEQELRKIPKERIKFFGYLNDEQELMELYKSASCFVFPSFYEGAGMPPIEALACGCPIVVSHIPALKERCGDAAVYCVPDNDEDIAQKILMVLQDENLRNRLIVKGLERAKMFSWEKTARETIKVFEAVLQM